MKGKNRIAEIVIRDGRTKKAIAADAKLSEAELSRIINHKSSPTFESMIKIAAALYKDIWDVFYVDFD